MIGKKLSSTDYLLIAAFFGVLIAAMSSNMVEEFARYSGVFFGTTVVIVALGVGVWQGRHKRE
jgi:hypothetical protein